MTKGKVLRAWTSSYLQNARGSMVRSGWGRCIQNSLEPYYHRKVNIPLQGKYLPARLNGPEKFPPSIYRIALDFDDGHFFRTMGW